MNRTLSKVHQAARQSARDDDPLSRLERAGIAIFFVVIVVFSGIVELRSGLLGRRRTDLGVFLRAAWAVRTGADVYQITDDNMWHYHYPPLFAILMMPLADPPSGASRSGSLPFTVSVAIWYWLNIFFLTVAANSLANVLERNRPPNQRAGPKRSRRWWALRLFPILTCLPAIGLTLARSQVNVLLLMLLCLSLATALRGQNRRAGLWLAGAICLKVMPAYLLIYPIWRKNLGMLAGCALGLLLGFVVVPVAVFGTSRTVDYYREWNHVLLSPALAVGHDTSRLGELIGVNATHSQSLQTIIHNTLYANETIYLERARRPSHMSVRIRLASWIIGGFLTGITLWAAGWRRRFDAISEVILFGALMVLMIVMSPVCHLHYFALSMVLVMGLLAAAWDGAGVPRLSSSWRALFSWNIAGTTLPQIPRLDVFEDLGISLYTALTVWLIGVAVLRRRCRRLPSPGDG